MRRIIAQVKRDSKHNKLNDVFTKVPKTIDASAQTDAYAIMPTSEYAVIQSDLKTNNSENALVQAEPLPPQDHYDVTIEKPWIQEFEEYLEGEEKTYHWSLQRTNPMIHSDTMPKAIMNTPPSCTESEILRESEKRTPLMESPMKELESDDVELASCKKRIAPWIISSLMRPENVEVITNHFDFEQLADTISEKLISKNQYPGNLCFFNRICLVILIFSFF